MKIATWNVNSIKARLPRVVEWLAEARPDVVLLQETKCVDDAFPRMEIEELGYNIALCGQKTYNGVAILSKRPLEDVICVLDGDDGDAQARYIEAFTGGVRVASMPGVTGEMLARVMGADLNLLRKRGSAVARVLGAGAEARITCTRGTDLRLGLEDRTAIVDAGALNMKGAFGNIPCGEAFIAPVEGSAEGTLVVDGSIAAIGKLHEPVELTIRSGHLTEATGTVGAQLLEMLTEHGPNGTNVAELGIGTNESAILTGNILEDEKILGTAHLAFGASAAIGGTVQVPVHLDCVLLRPTVEIDGAPIVQAGTLTV